MSQPKQRANSTSQQPTFSLTAHWCCARRLHDPYHMWSDAGAIPTALSAARGSDTGPNMSTGQIEITGLAKSGGPLTKRIHLGDDGKLISDGSACVMSHGTACRVRFDCLDGFANYFGKLSPNHAIALGALGPDLPDNVGITTKGKLAGAAQPDLITRTRDQ